MPIADTQLPDAFADLQNVALRWALPSEAERDTVRWAAQKEDFEALHEAMMPRLPDILALLSQHDRAELDDGMRTLFYLTCAFAEASPHHELYRGSAEVPFSFKSNRFIAEHADKDSAST